MSGFYYRVVSGFCSLPRVPLDAFAALASRYPGTLRRQSPPVDPLYPQSTCAGLTPCFSPLCRLFARPKGHSPSVTSRRPLSKQEQTSAVLQGGHSQSSSEVLKEIRVSTELLQYTRCYRGATRCHRGEGSHYLGYGQPPCTHSFAIHALDEPTPTSQSPHDLRQLWCMNPLFEVHSPAAAHFAHRAACV